MTTSLMVLPASAFAQGDPTVNTQLRYGISTAEPDVGVPGVIEDDDLPSAEPGIIIDEGPGISDQGQPNPFDVRIMQLTTQLSYHPGEVVLWMVGVTNYTPYPIYFRPSASNLKRVVVGNDDPVVPGGFSESGMADCGLTVGPARPLIEGGPQAALCINRYIRLTPQHLVKREFIPAITFDVTYCANPQPTPDRVCALPDIRVAKDVTVTGRPLFIPEGSYNGPVDPVPPSTGGTTDPDGNMPGTGPGQPKPGQSEHPKPDHPSQPIVPGNDGTGPIKPHQPVPPGQRVPGPAGVPITPSGVEMVNPNPDKKRIAGLTRYETAVEISKAAYPDGTDTVILARGDVAADSVSAVPLSKHVQAPVLLTPPQRLHPVVQEEILRLKPKRVIVMGGEVAIGRTIDGWLQGQGIAVHRLAGANRAETAVATARLLATQGKAEQVLLVDGYDWQADLIVGPAAAQSNGVVLLTNGGEMAPETQGFLNAHKSRITAIGDKAKAAGRTPVSIEADSMADLSVQVATRFFGPKVHTVGIATTAEFADSLAGGAHVAKLGGPLILLPVETPKAVSSWFSQAQYLHHVVIYGGQVRISDDQVNGLFKP